MELRDENQLYELWRSAEGEEKANLERDLIRALQRHAYAVVWLRLRERRPEIVNEAVGKVLRSDSFRGEAKFSTWFYRVVDNLCLDTMRSEKKYKRTSSIEALSPDDLEALAITPTQDALDIDLLTRHLRVEDARLLRMKLRGDTEKEIGTRLGLSPKTVSNRWQRLKGRLQRKLRNGKKLRAGSHTEVVCA